MVLRQILHPKVTNSRAAHEGDRSRERKGACPGYSSEGCRRHTEWETIYESTVVHKNKLICFSTLMTKV